jgi:hypothetical protein
MSEEKQSSGPEAMSEILNSLSQCQFVEIDEHIPAEERVVA